MTIAIVALGSNLGDRAATITRALAGIVQHKACRLQGVSSYIETQAVADEPQPDYLNAVAEIETTLALRPFFALIQDIEKQLGRDNKGCRLPRTIDLDLLFFNQEIYSDQQLTVPHPSLYERRFVLEPLVELCPNYYHPVKQVSCDTLLEALS